MPDNTLACLAKFLKQRPANSSDHTQTDKELEIQKSSNILEWLISQEQKHIRSRVKKSAQAAKNNLNTCRNTNIHGFSQDHKFNFPFTL